MDILSLIIVIAEILIDFAEQWKHNVCISQESDIRLKPEAKDLFLGIVCPRLE